MSIYSRSNHPPGFYVYSYISKKGNPYYIGKGQNSRAWSNRHSVSVPKNEKYIVIMEANLTEVGALALERFYIRWYGRKDNGTGILRNKTDGGEGISGYIFSEEQITRKRLMFSNERNPMFGRRGKNNPNYGKKRPKISQKLKGRVSKLKGRHQSLEHKMKRSVKQKGILRGQQKIVICPHCQKAGGESLMHRYHFDKCRLR
jgi:hypothetical protein